MNTNIKTISEYMKALSNDLRAPMKKLYETIKAAAPKAEETISYGMPAFRYKGMLVYFAAFKNHYSFFPGNSTLIAKLKEELKPYKTSKGTIQFTLDKPLPVTLVKKMVKIRLKENEEKFRVKELLKKPARKTSKKKMSSKK